MSGCASTIPKHPLNPDGTCFYWKCVEANGTVHEHPVCTYWNNEAWLANCEAMGIVMQRQEAEQLRLRAMTPEERATEDGRLF